VTWLRYNTFYVLYPMGIISEVVEIFKCVPEARKRGEDWKWALWAVVAIYVPGSYILYTHMIKQRRKIIRGKQPERNRASVR